MADGVVAVVADAVDAEGLARFWAAALGWTAAGGLVRPPGGGFELRFAGGAAAKRGKNRLHLDLDGGAGQDAAVARLLRLGAVRADIGQGDVPWEVLADPEGNELCVLPRHRGEPGGGPLAQICLDAADAEAQGRFWSAATGWAVTERGEWGVCLRHPAGAAPPLVMGPPAAPKSGRNRLRLRLAAAPPGDPDARTDPEGNEFEVGA